MGLLKHREQGLWEEAEISSPMAGAMGAWQRAFYGAPDWGGSLRLSGLPAAITGYVSTLVTGELALSCGPGPRGKAMEALFSPVLEVLPKAVQLAAAFGCAVLRPMVEDGKILYTVAGPGRFFPVAFRADGRLTAGYFADRLGEYVKLERFRYQDGVLTVTNRVYRARGEVLGEEVPLSVRREWEKLSPETTLEGASGPLLGIIKMPFANTVDPDSPLPVSLYAGAMESMGEFDRVYSDLIYELRSGRRKNIVERGAIVPEGRRRGFRGVRYQDPTTDTYILDPAEEHDPFQDYSPELRVSGYLAGMKAILHIIENQCHLSPGSMAIDDRTGAMTATEVISQDRTTYHTCAAIQTRGVLPGLRGLFAAVETLGDLYGLLPPGECALELTFGDGVFEDTGKEFSRRMEMVKAGILDGAALRRWYFGAEENLAPTEGKEQAQ